MKLFFAFAVALFGLAATSGLAQPASALAAPDCKIPAELMQPQPALTRVRAALADKRLVILAIGGSTTTAAERADSSESYPARLKVHLARLLPGVAVELTVRASVDASPRHRAVQLSREVAELRPNLVLWANGTREAVRRSDPARYATALNTGITAAHASGADIILVEPQFAPGWAALPNLDTYRDVLRTVAELDGVPLFARHALMEAWHQSGVLDLAISGRVQQEAMVRRLFDCLGAALAGMVQRGSQ